MTIFATQTEALKDWRDRVAQQKAFEIFLCPLGKLIKCLQGASGGTEGRSGQGLGSRGG